MNLSIIPFALIGLVLLTGCPSTRPSDNNDDAADDGKPDPGDGDPTSTTSGKPDPGTPAAAGDGDGDPAATCEPERKALADCEAAK